MNKDKIMVTLKSKAASILFKLPISKKKYIEFLKSAKHEQMASIMNKMSLPSMYRMQRKLFTDCEYVQKTILYEILRANEHTDFGRKHHFSRINGIKGYRKCVPISEWDDYDEEMTALRKGEADVLFPGKALYFYETTGTTSVVKLVPESSRDNICREAIGKLKNIEKAMACNLVKEFISNDMKIFALTSTIANEYTEGGIPLGSASGRTASIEGSKSSDIMVLPGILPNYYEGEDYNYIVMRVSLVYKNISVIMGNNAALMTNIINYGINHAKEIIDDIRTGTCRLEMPEEVRKTLKDVLVPAPERADELEILRRDDKFIPKYYWPDLKAASFWLSGSVGINIDSLRVLLPKQVRFMDMGYGSSEAKINIPLETETPSGALLTYTCFYEFLPLDGGEPLMAHEVKKDEDYELLLTTNSGLYRYRIHDIVHIDGFIGNTPMLHFLTKAGDIANLAQEKLYGVKLRSMIVEAVSERFETKFLQVYPDPEQYKYIIYIEPVGEISEKEKTGLSECVDKYMRKNHSEYNLYRDWALNMPEVRIMEKGWEETVFAEYSRDKANKTQVKVPVVRKTPYIETED